MLYLFHYPWFQAKSGDKPFANPRNAAVGSMRLLQTREGEQRGLNFTAFSISSIDQHLDTSGISGLWL
jgi:NAD-dependent DNA ligase